MKNKELVKVVFPQYNIEIEVPKGTSILEAAQMAGIGIRSVCGGKGYCGKCKVLVHGAIEHKLVDKSLLSKEDIARGYVLACLAKVLSNVEVFIPPETALGKAKLLTHVLLPKITPKPYITKLYINDYLDLVKVLTFYRIDDYLKHKIESGIEEGKRNIAVVNSLSKKVIDVRENENLYGIAVDIGTTKIVVALVNVTTGEIIDVESEFNKQIMYGEDLVSRISYTIDKKDGLKELQKVAIDIINDLLSKLCKKHGINNYEIYEASVAGNTVMTYLFVGLDPYPLIRSFRIPVKVQPTPYILNAKDIGLNVNENANVYVLPCSGRFLGGDVIGDILTAGVNFSEDPALLIDIGTNTEVVIGCKHWFMGTTAPAGPAFEGWGLKCGVRAILGAIESVKIDSKTLEAHYSTIGNAKPIGICGSGYIDLLAQLFINGIIDRQGKFYRHIESPYIRKGAEGYEYVVVPADESATGKDIVITEKDIYNLIDAKSSVCAAVSIILKKMYLSVEDVKKIFICGAFGRYLDINSAMAIGMIPEFPNAEIVYIGNGSLGGAYLTLISKTYRQEAERIARNMAVIELMLDPNFMEEYEAGFILPGKPELFPSWWRASREIKPWRAL